MVNKNNIRHKNKPRSIFILFNKGFVRPKNIMQKDNICNIPKKITSFGIKRYVIIVIASAITNNFKPLFRFDLERFDDTPETKIKTPAKKGSKGIKNLIRFDPIGIENINAMV
jgi:hypothetical protein